MADFLIMAKDTPERSGRQWIAELTALGWWGAYRPLTFGREMKTGDRVLFYWTNKKLFVGSATVADSPGPVTSPLVTPLLAAVDFQIRIQDVDLWEASISSHMVKAAGIEIQWFPAGIIRLKPGQLDAIKGLTSERKTGPGPAHHRTLPTVDHWRAQAQVARLGVGFGCQVWVPRNNRKNVLGHAPELEPTILDALPLTPSMARSVEEIDCIWLHGDQVVAAFEIEVSTEIYSGLLRMADLVAVYPSISFDLFIVASQERLERFCSQVNRPVFSRLKESLATKCGFLSFDNIGEMSELQGRARGHLNHSIIRELAHWEG